MQKAKRHYQNNLTLYAKALRQQPTPAEKKLWAVLKEGSFKFRRQQPIGNYIADFYCASAKCVVEIDGASHDQKEASDGARDMYMKNQGIVVLRFSESDALRDPVALYQTILSGLVK
jgi:very-short-patch-repair endonuclease